MPVAEKNEDRCLRGGAESQAMGVVQFTRYKMENEDQCSDAYVGRQRAKLQEWFS